MGMSLTAKARIRWIRILVVILALTASRKNFPLQETSLRSKSSPKAEQTSSKHRKKSEGVTPSRRQVESRRIDWVRSLAESSEIPPSLRAVLSSSQDVHLRAPEADVRGAVLCSVSPCPEHLRLFLEATSTSSLPPPA